MSSDLVAALPKQQAGKGTRLDLDSFISNRQPLFKPPRERKKSKKRKRDRDMADLMRREEDKGKISNFKFQISQTSNTTRMNARNLSQ